MNYILDNMIGEKVTVSFHCKNNISIYSLVPHGFTLFLFTRGKFHIILVYHGQLIPQGNGVLTVVSHGPGVYG